MTREALPVIRQSGARAIAPRKPLTVSQWADAERIVSSKQGGEPGRWRTSRNPMLREPMDCMSARSPVHEAWLMFCIQSGKTETALNVIGYTMDHDPCPIMVCLPGESGMNAWVTQKLGPMLAETPSLERALTSTSSRDSANQRTFKDFDGGQLYLEHAGSPQRLKSKSVRKLIVDEADGFAAALGQDDPLALLEGRTSAFPSTYKRLFIGSPEIKGASRSEEGWEKSDQRRYHVPCPHCGHEQHLEWAGLHFPPDGEQCWYVCRECGCMIEEFHKPAMLQAGRWIPKYPERKIRGYHLNALYHPLGLGPRWIDLVTMWRSAQNDPARLKTFVNDRLAEPWEDPAMRAIKHNLIADRAEPRPLRPVPAFVGAVTAGVDTQDNRLAVQIVGWGHGLASWTIDYVELPGDPADDAVWLALTDLLNRPIDSELGGWLRVEAVAIDGGGHRTEDVKNYVRSRMVRRPMVIFGAKPNNAPVLSKGKMQDVTWRGKYDKRGVMIHHVGTVAIKHRLYSRLSADADKQLDARHLRFSDELEPEYFGGLVSETYNPGKNRFEPRRGGPRNEPLDTWVYAYAAAHHPELRLHRATKADWAAREARLRKDIESPQSINEPRPEQKPQRTAPQRATGFAGNNWGFHRK